MGRPQINRASKLSKRFVFRISDAQQQLLLETAKLCGKTPGSVVREKLFKGRFPAVKASAIDMATFMELKKIGVNINQLTRLANSGRFSLNASPLLSQLLKQQEIIIAMLTHDSRSENR